MDDLDAFLDSGTEQSQPETIEAEQPETIGQPRDEHGRFAPIETGVEPQETAEPVPPTGKLPKDVYEPLKAIRNENQSLKDELAALRQQFQAIQTPAEPPAPPPSVWEDEQAWGGNLVSQAVQQASLNARLDMSEMMVRQANEDFDEMKAKFLEMMALNPTLQQQAMSDPHPWNKAYQIAKNAAKMEALGATDIGALEAKLREQIRAEMAAQQPTTQTPSLPNSLADSQSARVSQGGAPALLSLEDILKR